MGRSYIATALDVPGIRGTLRQVETDGQDEESPTPARFQIASIPILPRPRQYDSLIEPYKRRCKETMARNKEFDTDEVLERAMNVFWCNGYAGTSVRDLVETMQIQRGSLYGTFKDKRTLFRLAYERYDARRSAGMQSEDAPVERIRAWFARLVEEGCNENGTRGCFIVNTALELEMHDEDMRTAVAKSLRNIEAFFFDNIRAGQEDGSIDRGIDARTTAQMMLSSVIGLRVLSRSRPERSLLRNIAEAAISPIVNPTAQ